VYVLSLSDEHNRNPKDRRCLVVEVTDTQALVVAITGEYVHGDKHFVKMPWSRGGHPVTSLNKDCAAKLTWKCWVDNNRCEPAVGRAPATLMLSIQAKLKSLPK